MGTRVKAGKAIGPYEFETYGEVKKKRDALGSGLVLLGQKKGRPVGIYSINRSEVSEHLPKTFSFVLIK